METKSIPLLELFDFPAIKGLTEEFIMKNQGDIPVYGGKMTETPIGYISDNLPDVKYFSDCLAWNREGSVGYVFYHKDKFSTNDHHRPLILKKEYEGIINLEYVRIVLEQFLLSQGFSWGKTASKEKVKKMSILFPVNNYGYIDVLMQERYVNRYNEIFNIQKRLHQYKDKLEKSIVILENNSKQRTIFLSEDYFKLSIGKRILKKNLVTSGIDVYSANPNKPFGKVRSSNLSSFDMDSIIWGIDGTFDWGYIPKNKVFATTDHCGRLIIENSSILSEYVYFQLKETVNSYGFNRTYRASLENIKTVSINIPISEDGTFDIELQKKMIDKYKKISKIKLKILNLLDYITTSQIDI